MEKYYWEASGRKKPSGGNIQAASTAEAKRRILSQRDDVDLIYRIGDNGEHITVYFADDGNDD